MFYPHFKENIFWSGFTLFKINDINKNQSKKKSERKAMKIC